MAICPRFFWTQQRSFAMLMSAECTCLRLVRASGLLRLCDGVDKQNEASLATHRACGVAVVSENGYDDLRKETDGGSYGMEFAYNPASG